ncbi:MAG: MFS transporter [Burkholderiaceae bacterium]|jgi:predicted MFS family arabinose efflux permease|nr:MFS transporter [Burkholderiaceae bacterium]
MTPAERRAAQSLAGIFALRMLGLFLVLPVFVLEAAHLPGGDDPALVGLAMGIYGLTQAVMQMPLGLASDRIGRKKVIVLGLLIFALGSAWAALADSVQMLVAARALQGAGAMSAAVTALLADLTRDQVRTKGMALVGMSIAGMFALSLVIAPPLAGVIGLRGLFGLTALLALAGIALVLLVTPPEPARHADESRGRLAEIWLHPNLWRLDLGVWVLHTVQMAMWSVVPALLVHAGLDKAQHWHVYLPAVLASFVMLGGLFAAERRGQLRLVLRVGVALLLLVQLALWLAAPRVPGLWTLGVLMFLFFAAFNLLEATQPSLISRLAPSQARGAALGVYNTLQSLGLFAGGALGGWLVKGFGPQAVFAATAALAALWLALSWTQPIPSGVVR